MIPGKNGKVNWIDMNWRERQKEEYSFYVTGAVILIAIVLVIAAVVQQLFFK